MNRSTVKVPLIALFASTLPMLALAQRSPELSGAWTRNSVAPGRGHGAPGIPASWFIGPNRLAIVASESEVQITRSFAEISPI